VEIGIFYLWVATSKFKISLHVGMARTGNYIVSSRWKIKHIRLVINFINLFFAIGSEFVDNFINKKLIEFKFTICIYLIWYNILY